MSGKRKSESTISAPHEEKKPKDSQSIIVHSSEPTSTNTMTTPTSVQNSLQPLLDTTNSLQGAAQPKRIKINHLQPEQPIPPVPQTSTPTLPVAPLPPQQKQMVEVKSLGRNTVKFKNNQMIVSGPDLAQAQLIAKQLSSGAAKLATLYGKQVLISTTPLSKSDTNVENLKSDTEKNNNSEDQISESDTEGKIQLFLM